MHVHSTTSSKRLPGPETSHLQLGGSWWAKEPEALPGSRVRRKLSTLLGGSGVVISGVKSPRIWVKSIVTLIITLLITTHEPPSRGVFQLWAAMV